MSLNGAEAKVARKNVWNFCDTLDLFPFVKQFKGQDLYELRDFLSEKFPYRDQYSESLFDYIGIEEFASYLNKRYGLHIVEVCDPVFIVTDK